MAKPDIFRCAIYVRVSTEEQNQGDFTSIQAQELHCKKFIASRKDERWVYIATYEDPGISGRKLNRPGLLKAVDMVRRGHVDAIIVYRRDRLSRSVPHLNSIEAYIASRGGVVISATEPAQGNSAAGKFTKGVLDLVGQFEVDLDIERVQDKVRANAERGLRNTGRPSFGYSYDVKTKQLLVDEKEAVIVRRIFKEAAAGTPLAKIAEGLRIDGIRQRTYPCRARGVVDGETVMRSRHFPVYQLRRLLENPLYRGVVRAKNPALREAEASSNTPEWVEFPGQHTALVTADEWQLANKNLATPKTFMPRLTQRDKHGYILKGVLECECGYAMTTSYSSKRRPDGTIYRYYRCVRDAKEGPNAPEGQGCPCALKFVPAAGIESAVLNYIHRVVTQPGLIQQTVAVFTSNSTTELAAAEAEQKALQTEYAETDRRLRSLLTQLADQPASLADAIRDEATNLASRRQELHLKQSALSERVKMLRSANPDADQVKAAFANFARLVRVLPISAQKELIGLVCERIKIGRPVSAAYFRAIKAGASPRMYRVQLMLNTVCMNDLDIMQGGLIPNARPKANLEMAFTVNLPANGKVVELMEGDQTIQMPTLADKTDQTDVTPAATNVVARAKEWAKLCSSREQCSAAEIAAEIKVSPATLSLHLKLLKKLDPGIVNYLLQSDEEHTHRWFSLRELLKLSDLPPERQRDIFKQGVDEAASRSTDRN